MRERRCQHLSSFRRGCASRSSCATLPNFFAPTARPRRCDHSRRDQTRQLIPVGGYKPRGSSQQHCVRRAPILLCAHWRIYDSDRGWAAQSLSHPTYLFPAHWPPALVVLHEQVGGPDLAGISASPAVVGGPGPGIGAVELGHVDLELLGVCSWWGLPAGVAVVRVEVVGQVL